jgi:hypothetical protein
MPTFRTVAVTLPVTIIYVNSIDMLPNSLSQAAASIKAKRNRTVPAEESGLISALSSRPRFYCALSASLWIALRMKVKGARPKS